MKTAIKIFMLIIMLLVSSCNVSDVEIDLRDKDSTEESLQIEDDLQGSTDDDDPDTKGGGGSSSSGG